MLEELGVPYEHIQCRPWSDEAKRYHPMGKIPALVLKEEDQKDLVVLESAAINTFLADRYDKLIPQPKSRRRALYDQTIHFIMSELDAQALWIHRKHASLGKVFGEAPTAVETAKNQFSRANACLVDQLNPYLLGEDFSAADILYVHCLDWAGLIGWDETWKDNETTAAAIETYLERCRSRPAYQRTQGKREEEKKASSKI